MYKAVNKNKFIPRYMEALSLHIDAPTVYWEDNTSFISVVEDKIVSPIFKHVYIPVCFLQEKFNNGLFIPNIISPVSCRQICAPNHVQVQ